MSTTSRAVGVRCDAELLLVATEALWRARSIGACRGALSVSW